ncbi:hypothetical protein CYMTET_25112 [Cymbomonas tetramitiformis]|uniref:Uncharacterized protein n=1 Tax=Cymbomonas tetramitiformis TaxID=36881 RepID=A0AAE0FV82_9CHLO|nr:hypothetical protein CYMTET_25112 [Cymbomonas tetramitiformis]
MQTCGRQLASSQGSWKPVMIKCNSAKNGERGGDSSDLDSCDRQHEMNGVAKIEQEAEKPTVWEDLSEAWAVLTGPKLKEDTGAAAVELRDCLLVIKGELENSEAEQEAAKELYMDLTFKYWGYRTKRITTNPAVRRLLPGFNMTLNLAVVAVLFRVLVPRMLALNTATGFDDFSTEYGLPDRQMALPTACTLVHGTQSTRIMIGRFFAAV